jgi:4-amino-4-deoxy-L-arabinose transferase-like glycosyltransferase
MAEPAPIVSRRYHALWVLGAGLLLTLPFLGLSGLAHSEGFRVYPGWEMLETGDWLLVRLFEQPYLRKPPGMPWACALSALVLGCDEFSARVPSALAIALSGALTCVIVQRWFGRPLGLVAGLAFILLPLWWWYPSVARSAEIEALHNLFVLAASLLSLHALLLPALVVGQTPRPARLALAIAIAAAVAGMLLSKGPAGAPVLIAALLAGGWMRRGLAQGPGKSPRAGIGVATVGLAIIAGGALFGAWVFLARAAAANQPVPPVLEPPTRFLFQPQRLLAIAALPVAALLAGLPHALALVPLASRGPDAPGDRAPATMARALLATVAIALAIFMLAGVSNNRYAMPALALLPACVGAGAWKAKRSARAQARRADRSPARRPLLVRALRPAMLALALLAIGLSVYGEHRRITRTTGKHAGLALGRLLEGEPGAGVELWGDECFDTRPEVVRAAVEEATRQGQSIRARWMPRSARPRDARVTLPEAGSYLLLRTDDRPRAHDERPELPEYARMLHCLEHVATHEVHIFRFELYRVRPDSKHCEPPR